MATYADISQFLKAAKNNREAIVRAGIAAMSRAAQQVISDAQELCPVETGALKASAFAQPARLQGDNIVARIGFNANYALIVHERLDTYHPFGQAKFLSAAMVKNADKVATYVLEEMKKAGSDNGPVGAVGPIVGGSL